MKTTIKWLLAIFISCGSNFYAIAQEDDGPTMIWETIMLTPDNTKLKVLQQNMRTHNQKYHASGSAHEAMVYNIATGPNAGKLVWNMGPITFADLDSRPAAGGHDEDWRDNIMPYIKDMGAVEYWKGDNKLSNTAMLTGPEIKYPILYIRYHEVAEGQGYQLNGLLEKMSEAIKGMDGENPFGFYDNQFRQGFDNGRHLATISFLKNWAELDDDWNFKTAFVKVHGENAWQPWVDGMDNAMRNSWDEIWEYNKSMSGH